MISTSPKMYLIQVGAGSKYFYIVKREALLTSKPLIELDSRLKFVHEGVERIGYVVAISDNLEFLQSEIERLKPAFWLVVQYSTGATNFIQRVISQHEIIEGTGVALTGTVVISHMDEAVTAKVLYVCQNQSDALEQLHQSRDNTVGVGRRSEHTFDPSMWMLVQYQTNVACMHYAVVKMDSAFWKTDEVICMDILGFWRDSEHKIANQTENAETLLTELGQIRDICLQTKFPLPIIRSNEGEEAAAEDMTERRAQLQLQLQLKMECLEKETKDEAKVKFYTGLSQFMKG